jgi:uncharacterized YigZ family protein
MSDHFRTLAAPVEFRHKIERSEFLGIAFPVTREEDFFAELERVQKRHFDATHHCWAFRLSGGQAISPVRPGQAGLPALHSRTRSSDAGEPSGTAGKLILAAIEGAGFHDTGVVVVRWYGGVKLGTGGLSRAYRETAAETLKLATSLDRYLYARIRVVVPFEALNTVYRMIDPPHVLLAGESFGETYEFAFEVRLSVREAFEKRLRELRLATLP